MPQLVPEQELPPDVSAVLAAARTRHPDLTVEVHTPTADEIALGDAPAGYHEVTVSAQDGDVSYAIPLRDVDTQALEVWQVRAFDMPGAGALQSQHTDLAGALEAAAGSADHDQVHHDQTDAEEAVAARAAAALSELTQRVSGRAGALTAAQTADRPAGGREGWSHRRPERAAEQPVPGQDRSR